VAFEALGVADDDNMMIRITLLALVNISLPRFLPVARMAPATRAAGGMVPFTEVMALERLDDQTFRSCGPAYMTGGPERPNSAYGGHVYAQAALAAGRTVASGMVVHVCEWHCVGAEVFRNRCQAVSSMQPAADTPPFG